MHGQTIYTVSDKQIKCLPTLAAGYKGLVDLVVLDPATLLPTNSCDLQLLAKDGVYLMEIPRQ